MGDERSGDEGRETCSQASLRQASLWVMRDQEMKGERPVHIR